MLDAAGTVTFPFDQRLTTLALAAWRRYGKGRHAAALNYGDCFSYVLADDLEVPMLCVGADFGRTDITIVDVGAG